MERIKDDVYFMSLIGLGAVVLGGLFRHEYQSRKVDKALKRFDCSLDNVMERTEIQIADVEDRLTKLFDRYDSQLKDTQRIYSSVSRALGDK